LQNPTNGVATTSGVGVNILSTFDNSTWENILVSDYKDTYAVKLNSTCCDTNLNKMRIDGNNASGVTPLYIVSNNTSTANQATHITNSSLNHPGAGLPAVKISDTNSGHPLTVDFTNTYTETNSTDTTTAIFQVSGAKAVTFTNTQIRAEGASNSTAPAISVDNSFATALSVNDLHMGTGTSAFVYPATGVSNAYSGQTALTDAYGNLGIYRYAPSNFSSLTVSGQGSGSGADSTTVTVADSGGQALIYNEPSIKTAGQGANYRWCRNFNDSGGCTFTAFLGNNSTTATWSFSNTGRLTTYGEVATAGLGMAPITGFAECDNTTPCPSSATTLVSSAVNTLYTVKASVGCTGAVSSATAFLSITYTDVSNTAQTITAPTATCTTLGASSVAQLTQSFSTKSGTAIKYSVTTANAPTYQARVAVFQDGTY
jgi:hypothetical protein